jgi:hypothetical protein
MALITLHGSNVGLQSTRALRRSQLVPKALSSRCVRISPETINAQVIVEQPSQDPMPVFKQHGRLPDARYLTKPRKANHTDNVGGCAVAGLDAKLLAKHADGTVKVEVSELPADKRCALFKDLLGAGRWFPQAFHQDKEKFM